MISNRWKLAIAALPIMSAVFGTLALAQPQPGGLGGFFQAQYGAKFAVAAFSPDSVDNLAAWYDASDASTISLVAGTNRVSEWRDKSGFDRHLEQTDASERPFYDTTQNGLNVIRMAGSELLQDAGSSGGEWSFLHLAQATVFVALEVDSAADNSGPFVMISTMLFTASGRGFLLFFDDRVSLGRTNRMRLAAGAWNNKSYEVEENDLIPTSTPLAFAIESDPLNATAANRVFVYDSNDTRINPDNTATGSTTDDNTGEFAVGGSSESGIYRLPMNIYEIIIYSNAVTATEREDALGYLRQKWGL